MGVHIGELSLSAMALWSASAGNCGWLNNIAFSGPEGHHVLGLPLRRFDELLKGRDRNQARATESHAPEASRFHPFADQRPGDAIGLRGLFGPQRAAFGFGCHLLDRSVLNDPDLYTHVLRCQRNCSPTFFRSVLPELRNLDPGSWQDFLGAPSSAA